MGLARGGGGGRLRDMESALHMPMLLEPVYKEYIWGGSRFLEEFHRRLNPGRYAESWEISDHPDGRTRIINGPAAGMTLGEAMARFGREISGGGAAGAFPLLVKLIDARETLSVQVHPDDAGAAKYGGEAKSEMWYVLSATPDAHIYSGFLPGTRREDFERARKEGTIPSLLQRYPARPGMIFNTPGGRVHAIGAGCLLLEVQQDANTTYRLYDWDRVDARTGRPRALHLEKAMQVIHWDATQSPIAPILPDLPAGDGLSKRLLLDEPHFHVEEWTVGGNASVRFGDDRFHILFPVNGDLRVKTTGQPAMILECCSTCLLPAAIDAADLRPANDTEETGAIRVLVIREA